MNNNKHLQHLGITVPIIQAPMAGTATPELAAAVSNAGALGSLGLGSSTAAAAQEAIVKTKSLTSAPFNVNLFCHEEPQQDTVREAAWLNYLQPFFNEFNAQAPTHISSPGKPFNSNNDMLDVILTELPPIVSFHFGLPPAQTIKKLKQAGIVLMATATCLEEAITIENAGLDFIVAQGWEAGGHRGIFNPDGHDSQLTTQALVSILAKHCALPLIAAGGIMKGSGISAALKLGACAAQMGTAFVLCPESDANQAYRDNLSSSKAFNTSFTTAMSGRPARGLTCRVHTQIDTPARPALPDYPICYVATRALQKAAQQQGNHEFDANWAGQGAPLARAMPAAELVKLLEQELAATR